MEPGIQKNTGGQPVMMSSVTSRLYVCYSAARLGVCNSVRLVINMRKLLEIE